MPDLDLAPPETTAPAETAPDTAPTPIPAEKTSAPASAPISHIPGGLPAIPLAVIAGNSIVGLLSAAALTGGPGAVAGAAGAAVVTGAMAVRTASSKTRKKARPAAGSASRSGSSSAGRAPRTGAGQGRSGGTSTSRGSGRHATARKAAPLAVPKSRPTAGAAAAKGRPGPVSLTKGPRATPKNTKTTAPGKASAPGHAKTERATGTKAGKAANGGKPQSRTAAIKAARAARKAEAPTRKAQRAKTTADRRRLADTRRAAKTLARGERLTNKGKAARTLAKPLSAIRKARDAAIDAGRKHRDQRTQDRTTRARQARRKGAARLRLTSSLARARMRLLGRRLTAAGIAAPIGALGVFTTWLGRRIGWAWLIQPGQRLYRRLSGAAALEYAERARAYRDTYDAELADDDTEDNDAKPTELVLGEVPRAPRHHNTGPTTAGDTTMTDGPGFLFDEAASEMETAAQAYNPEGMMHVLATLEGLPTALQSVANTFAVLAERADTEFPLEKEVGEALNEVYKALMQAIDAAAEVPVVFRQVHPQDIRRIEDPRNGAEAEKGWNPENNQ